MSTDNNRSGASIVGARASVSIDLKTLKAPEEGGKKKEYQDFLDKLDNHVSINWEFGEDISYIIKNNELPTHTEPTDLSSTDQAIKWKVRLWNQTVDRYGQQLNALTDNAYALFSLIMDRISKIMRGKVKSRQGFKKAESGKDIIWLLKAIEDIVLHFEETKPKLLAIDDQMERIMSMRQGTSTNDDFVKDLQKELKVFEKHGGDFLWGNHQKKSFEARKTVAVNTFTKDTNKEPTDEEEKELVNIVRTTIKEEILAMTIIKRADSSRFGSLQKKLKDDYILGQNNYPLSVPDVLKVLNNHSVDASPSPDSTTRNLGNTSSGGNETTSGISSVSFLQTNGNLQIRYLRGTNDSFHRNITCRHCGFKGHYQPQCPAANSSGNRLGTGQGPRSNTSEGAATTSEDTTNNDNTSTQEVRNLVQNQNILLNQSIDTYINPRWVLLDSESTDHIFCNSELLTDIKTTSNCEYLRLHTSAGFIDTYEKGFFGNFPVWYNSDCIANVLSLALVSEQFRVTMDTSTDNSFKVHISEEHVITFTRVTPGLYLFDSSNIDLHKLRHAFSFLNTVASNRNLFKQREARKADDAITLNRRINHSAKDKFIRIVRDNWIRNNPITIGDVRRSHAIYGPPIPPIKGRTRYQESKKIPSTAIIELPKSLYEDLKNVILCVDFHFVNGVTVFHTISRTINYRTVSFPMGRSRNIIMEEIKKIYKVYNSRGFRIVDIHADNEFEKVRQDLLPTRLHTCAVDEHIPEIERSVQTQKNENRSVCYAMPYRCFPRLMVRELVTQGNNFLNAFGNKDNLGHGLSPRNIIDNLPHIDYNHLSYEFGQYVQLHVTEKLTNTMASRTIGAIVLSPNNIQGQYNFMSLETGKKIEGKVISTLPITTDVISRVETLGTDQRQPLRASRMLKYEWRPGQNVPDNDNVSHHIDDFDRINLIIPDAIPTQYPTDPHAGPNPFLPLPPTVQHQGSAIPTLQPGTDNAGTDINNVTLHMELEEDIQSQMKAQGATHEVSTQRATQQEEVQGATHKELTQNEDTDLESDDDSIEERRNIEKDRRSEHFTIFDNDEHGKGKRERKPPENFSFLQSRFEDLDKSERNSYFSVAWNEYKVSGKTNLLERFTTGFIFNQLSAKKGIEKYGRAAELKLIAEFKQLMEYKTFHGIRAKDLTYEQRKGAANMINLIEEKTNRGHTPENPVIKARSVFNGRVQRGLYSKEETASPTVSQDAFFLTSIIDAMEGRDKAITDIKGAYLNARMKDDVFMKITGKEVQLFCELDPNLSLFVTNEKDKKVLYVQLDRALYGCVQSALLWYELYSTTLMEMGFTLNPYDLCVANCDIDDKQCTIVWYVDDNKISHNCPKVIDMVIQRIEKKFGKLSVTRGDKHEFLGMNIHFKEKKVKISMKKHIIKAMNDFTEDITRNASTPATSYLFEVRESTKLSEKRADTFHSVVASLLFISRRCRLDIQTALGFLTTRVSCPTEDDWTKLRRVLQYLRGTIDLILTLGADDIREMKSWVDVSYGVHQDCKSHTGGAISWGWGVLLTKCLKQKLNTKSSTEAEIVGVSDFMPNMIWTRMFLEAQNFIVTTNILYQDNQSAMKIEMNGKQSGGQKTKHMNIRYFWIKDRLKSEGIKVEYCPTGKMIADFFTKPLQGRLFKHFRDVVMGYKHINDLQDFQFKSDQDSSQERVRNNVLTENVISDVLTENVKLPVEDELKSNCRTNISKPNVENKKITWVR